MKKTILILTSDPFSINYEIIKKSQILIKKKLHNKYLFIGDQKDVGDNIKKDNKFFNGSIWECFGFIWFSYTYFSGTD